MRSEGFGSELAGVGVGLGELAGIEEVWVLGLLLGELGLQRLGL